MPSPRLLIYFTLFRNHLTLFVPGGGGKICPLLSYFNIAPKLKKSFALMYPEFESNLMTHIFRKFWSAGQPKV